MAKSQPKQTEPPDPILTELIAIKRLLICALMRTGANQSEIANALGVAQGTVSKMLSNGSTKPKRAKGGTSK